MALAGQSRIFRGATVTWLTTFKDAYGNVIQPDGAVLLIKYPAADDTLAEATVTMTAPTLPDEVRWLGLWDSRGALPGVVFWSIHTVQDAEVIPYAVEDGQFNLSANTANALTF